MCIRDSVKKATKQGLGDKIRSAYKAGVKRHRKATQGARVVGKGFASGAKKAVKFAKDVKKVVSEDAREQQLQKKQLMLDRLKLQMRRKAMSQQKKEKDTGTNTEAQANVIANEGVMTMIGRKKPEKKAEKAMDAGARAKRMLARKIHAKYVSGSTENVPDDIAEAVKGQDTAMRKMAAQDRAAGIDKRLSPKEGRRSVKPVSYSKRYAREETDAQLKSQEKAVFELEKKEANTNRANAMKKRKEEISEGSDKKGKGSGTKDACYHKVKSRYSVWPSAYASGALVKCRKKGAANWGNSSKKESYSWRDDFEYVQEGAAWTKKEGKNKSGGLNEKGRKSYERDNPGSDLKAPSKKVGNKRRASFCARMKGMKKKLTSAKTARDPDSRINKSLRAWNC